MPTGFKKINLASTEDHPRHNDKIRGWIVNNGGRYTGSSLSSDTTHLLCSDAAWDKSYPLVVDARRQRVKVVNIDWLLDAWIVNSGRPIRNTAKYEYAQRKFKQSPRTLKTDKKADQKADLPQPPRMLSLEDTAKQLQNKLRQKEAQLESNDYSLYLDANGFPYSIALARADAAEAIERCMMYTDNQATDPGFCILAAVTDSIGRAVVHDAAPQGCPKAFAMTQWRKLFKLRTGLEWSADDGNECAERGNWRWNGKEVVWWRCAEDGRAVDGRDVVKHAQRESKAKVPRPSSGGKEDARKAKSLPQPSDGNDEESNGNSHRSKPKQYGEINTAKGPLSKKKAAAPRDLGCSGQESTPTYRSRGAHPMSAPRKQTALKPIHSSGIKKLAHPKHSTKRRPTSTKNH